MGFHPEKFACPTMRDPNIRNRFNALSACVIANCVLAKLSIDQGGELGTLFSVLAICYTGPAGGVAPMSVSGIMSM